MKKLRQLKLVFRMHGGKRRGAGRKPNGSKPTVSHRSRPKFSKATPVHVTLRICDDVPSLRSSRRFAAVRRCFVEARGRFGLRLAEFTVLSNHLHLIVEADDDRALTRGVQGLCIRIAKAINALLERAGKTFADHYHARLLMTPTELCRAIRYVRENAAHHYEERGPDPCSSAASDAQEILVAPVGWLLRAGWRRAAVVIAPTVASR
jgi:REP element-mobilizing transposase RayT